MLHSFTKLIYSFNFILGHGQSQKVNMSSFNIFEPDFWTNEENAREETFSVLRCFSPLRCQCSELWGLWSRGSYLQPRPPHLFPLQSRALQFHMNVVIVKPRWCFENPQPFVQKSKKEKFLSQQTYLDEFAQFDPAAADTSLERSPDEAADVCWLKAWKNHEFFTRNSDIWKLNSQSLWV